MPDPWIGSHEAATLAEMSRLALFERALRGEVKHQLVAGRRVFDRADCEKLRGVESTNA